MELRIIDDKKFEPIAPLTSLHRREWDHLLKISMREEKRIRSLSLRLNAAKAAYNHAKARKDLLFFRISNHADIHDRDLLVDGGMLFAAIEDDNLNPEGDQ